MTDAEYYEQEMNKALREVERLKEKISWGKGEVQNLNNKVILEMTDEEAIMLADYLNNSQVADDENIITTETVRYVTSLIPKLFDLYNGM